MARGSTGNTVGRFIFMAWLATGAGVGDALTVADSLFPTPAPLLGEEGALGDGLEVADGIIESFAVAVWDSDGEGDGAAVATGVGEFKSGAGVF